MRITNQMMANVASKNGMPYQSMSLLDYMNNDSSTTELLSGITQNDSTINTLKENNYTKLLDSSGKLNEDALSLASTKEDSIFNKAEESNNTDDIVNTVKDMIKQYNAALKQLKLMGDPLDTFYMKQMQMASSEVEESLNSVGITIAKDGSMVVDSKVLEDSDLDTLKNVFGGETDFIKKISYISGKVNDNANTNIESITNKYGSDGLSYSNEFEASKYNFLV